MSINPVTLNGTLSRVQDMTMIKHNEDTKGAVDQNNFQTQFQKEINEHVTRVRQSDDSDMAKTRKDAKDKGDNEYAGDGGRRRKRGEDKKDGKVIVRGRSSFDMKV